MSSIALPEALGPAAVGNALRRRANMFLKRAEEMGCKPGRLWWNDFKAKAELEYARYRTLLDSQPQRVDAEFEKAAKELKRLPRPKKPKPPKS